MIFLSLFLCALPLPGAGEDLGSGAMCARVCQRGVATAKAEPDRHTQEGEAGRGVSLPGLKEEGRVS